MDRQAISNILHKTLHVLLILSWVIIFVSFFFIKSNLQPIGLEMGNWAIRFLWLSSLPGILKRFRATGFLQNIQIVLMRSRRRLGDLMFSFAVMHYLWNSLFFNINIGANIIPIFGQTPLFKFMGFFGLLILIPLFLTSNNFSVRFLKVWWTRIHRLVYLAMWFVAFHVALQGLVLEASITFAIGILQIASWIFYKIYMKKNQQGL
ncbi:hypothetical protein A3F29_02965 [Candidatus Roizmanbacteria bacterium RIFCSPHIGHO2_12_FULL_33_9]|uniref:Ferric oxidoreductase domain-containing protein n=1 Tax=Candidatus Roizmanbacteria bacterium RIFCSPHIGHO2_12_FULL_33_9 TaxID=1802045 RepID=A0A1F7HIL2_9BACT|nr:MAG: hypothetical protein A3F29_02965 [Candidatus Roizmanbacteria bacterium RIFCSPHIGHO2_12_FULL_33_9]